MATAVPGLPAGSHLNVMIQMAGPAASLPASHSFAGGRMRVRDSIESHLTIVFAALAFSRDAQARNVFVSKGAAGHCPGLPTARGDPD